MSGRDRIDQPEYTTQTTGEVNELLGLITTVNLGSGPAALIGFSSLFGWSGVVGKTGGDLSRKLSSNLNFATTCV